MEPGPSAARAKERKRGIELNITLLFVVYHGPMKKSNPAYLSTSFLSSVGVHLHATQGRRKRSGTKQLQLFTVKMLSRTSS
jgi:hypothetical protein